MKNKLIFLFLGISLINGCTFIETDYYYHSNNVAEEWAQEFRPGMSVRKYGGYPDAAISSVPVGQLKRSNFCAGRCAPILYQSNYALTTAEHNVIFGDK